MKEYSILIRHGSGRPYILGTYLDAISVKHAVQNLADYEEKRNRMYFVDNDFFCNKYPFAFGNCKYMKVQIREVTEWQKYEEEKQRYETNKIAGDNNKIIYLNKFIKNT